MGVGVAEVRQDMEKVVVHVFLGTLPKPKRMLKISITEEKASLERKFVLLDCLETSILIKEAMQGNVISIQLSFQN